MQARNKKMKRTIIIAAIFAVLGTPAAMAQPAEWHYGEVAVRDIDVYTGDLNLADPGDRHEAAERIEHAAHAVCQPNPDRAMFDARDYRGCHNEAYAEGIDELEGRRPHRRGHVTVREYISGEGDEDRGSER